MAYNETGAFYPSESSFRTPGAYGAFLSAQGQTKAKYLADMDQFYAQLTEVTRQYNETLGFKKEELAFSKEKWGQELGQRKSEFDQTLAYNRWLAEQNNAFNEKQLKQNLTLGTRELDIREKAVDKTGAKTIVFDPKASSLANEASELDIQKMRGMLNTTPAAPKSGEVTGAEASAARSATGISSGIVQPGETWNWIDDPKAQW